MPRTLPNLLIALCALSLACDSNTYAPPPPPTVTVQEPLVRDVIDYLEYTGTTEAVESVEVRARVEGFLVRMAFTPGDQVEKGALLFVIDPEPFEVALKAATGALTSRQAALDLAETEYERVKVLFEKSATSELAYIQARAKRDTALAAVTSAEAEVRTAELDLEYAHVKAPITGRVGRNLIDIGNLVGADGATVLTDMVRYSPLYVYVQLSERDLLALQQWSIERRAGKGDDWEREKIAIEVGKANEEGFPHLGTLDFSALQVDPDTGTFELRGALENLGRTDEIIIPGTFVRTRIPIAERKGALLISERAIGMDQSGRYLLVVNSEDIVEQRRIEVGAEQPDGLRVISKGIRKGDLIVVNGLQRARPGSKVNPERAKAASASDETGA